jgi:hypothetical protein
MIYKGYIAYSPVARLMSFFGFSVPGTLCHNLGYKELFVAILKTAEYVFLSQAALKAAKQTKDGRDDEIAVLRTEIEVIFANKNAQMLSR